MKAPFFWLSLGFVSGLLAYPYMEKWVYAVSFCGIFLFPFLWASRGRRLFLPLLTAGFFSLGFFYAHLDRFQSSQRIDHWADGKWVSVRGTVYQEPEVSTHGKRVKASFVLRADGLELTNAFGREFVPVNGFLQIHAFQPSLIPEIGEKIRIWGKLEKPKSLRNPGGFDYERYLWSKNIGCLLYSYGGKSLRSLQKGSFYSFLKVLQRIRRFLSEKIENIFSSPYDALYQALLLGKRKELEESLRDDFLKTGTSHVNPT